MKINDLKKNTSIFYQILSTNSSRTCMMCEISLENLYADIWVKEFIKPLLGV